jgi:hypothetical protein
VYGGSIPPQALPERELKRKGKGGKYENLQRVDEIRT